VSFFAAVGHSFAFDRHDTEIYHSNGRLANDARAPGLTGNGRLCYFQSSSCSAPEGIPVKNTILLCLTVFFAVSGLWAEEARIDPPSREEARPKTGRAFLEMGLNWSISAINYNLKYSKFIEDWQFELTWKDQKRKFFTSEGLRLDSNNLSLNWTHAWAGAVYYSWARTNRLGILSSSLFSTAGSLLWEYVAEWREVASINDQVFTAAGGPAIGEPLFQIADHFRRRPGIANRIACLLVDPPLAINDFLDGKNRAPRLPARDWSDFCVSLGYKHGPASYASGLEGHAALDIDLRLVTLPGYGRPGSGSGYSRLPIDNGYRIATVFNTRMMEEMALATRTVLGGWWRKNVREDSRGELRGSELWLGPLMGWELFLKKPVAEYDGKDLDTRDRWFEREQPTRYVDKHSLIRLFGPACDWTGYAGGLTVRTDLDATFDFGMVNSLAYNDYSAGHDVWGVKTTLHNWGYYYSLGYTIGGRFDLRYGALRVAAGIKYQRFRSIQGLDRFQNELLDDAPLRDSRFAYDAGLAVALPRTPLFLSLNLEGIDRRGRFHEISKKNHELRFFYRLGVAF
jgi:hypothetical protein